MWEGLRGVLSIEDPLPANMSQQRMERNQLKDFVESGEERHQSQIRLSVDLTAQTAPHTCVLVSSLNRINDLFKEHSHLHESNDGLNVFFGLRTHAV